MPNNQKQCGIFDEELILKQLNTSSTISYAKFIRFGYPKRIPYKKLADACKPIEDNLKKICHEESNIYTKVILSIGLSLNNFKLGNDTIFFRSKQFHLMEKFFSDRVMVSEIAENNKTMSSEDSMTPQKRKPK